MSEKESIGELLSRITQGLRIALGKVTIFDVVIWLLFVFWCVIKAPVIQRHAIEMARAADLKTGDFIWNMSHDLFPFVAAFGIAVLAVRLLRRLNRWMK